MEYQQAADFSKKIVASGFMVITGAGPSIMQAGHEGAGPERVSARTSGCRGNGGQIPSSPKTKKLVTFKYFFTRKLTFIRQSDAIVLFPGGGFGTLDEG